MSAVLLLLAACGATAPPGDGGDGGDDTAGDGGEPAAQVLVYGPTDLADAELLAELGAAVTVWDAETWLAADTAAFSAFDLVVVGEQSCEGPDRDGELDALIESGAAWGPALDGRVVVSGMDLVCHLVEWDGVATGDAEAPAALYANHVAWLLAGEGTAASFATTWGRRADEPLAPLGEWVVEAVRGDKVDIVQPEHPLFAGIAPGALDNWNSSYHSRFPTWPADFEPVASGIEAAGVIMVRDPAR